MDWAWRGGEVGEWVGRERSGQLDGVECGVGEEGVVDNQVERDKYKNVFTSGSVAWWNEVVCHHKVLLSFHTLSNFGNINKIDVIQCGTVLRSYLTLGGI